MRKQLPLLLAVVLGVVLLAAIVVSYLSGQRIQNTLFNADAIQTPALFENVFGQGGSFGDWNLAPAPAVFPEFLMYALAYVFGPTTFLRILIYALIQVIIYAGVIFLLAREVSQRHPGRMRAVVATVFIMSSLVLLGLLGVANYRQIFQSSFHFGGLLCQLFSIVLVLRLSRPENSKTVRRVIIATLCVIAIAATLSDALYAVQFLVPFAVWCVLWLLRRQMSLRQALVWAGLPAVSGILGLLLYKVVIPNPKSSAARINPDSIIPNLKVLAGQLADVFTTSPALFVFIVAFFLFSGVATMYFVLRRNFLGLASPLHSLVVVSFLSGGFSLVACVIAQMGPSPRYLLPLFIFPFIVGGFILADVIAGKMFVVAALTAATAMTLGCGLIATTSLAAHGLSDSYYPATQRCIDDAVSAANVTHGVANYWDAKPIQEFSRVGLTLLQVGPNLRPFRWSSTNANEQGTFDFALINNAAENRQQPSLDELTRINGQPSTRVECAQYSLYSWGAGRLSLSGK
jgi:hypothetical protein